MTIHKGQIDADSELLLMAVALYADGPGNGIDKAVDSFKPGFPFQVEDVQIFTTAVTSQADVDVRIGSTSVLAAEETDPTADALTEPTLAAAASRQGDETDTIDLVIDTDGTGDLNARVHVLIRPHPAGGEAGA